MWFKTANVEIYSCPWLIYRMKRIYMDIVACTAITILSVRINILYHAYITFTHESFKNFLKNTLD